MKYFRVNALKPVNNSNFWGYGKGKYFVRRSYSECNLIKQCLEGGDEKESIISVKFLSNSLCILKLNTLFSFILDIILMSFILIGSLTCSFQKIL